MRRSALVIAFLVLFAVGGARAESVEVYRRATPTEALTGMVRIASTLDALAEVPRACEAGPVACREEARVGRLYRLEFFLETTRAGDAGVERSLEPRGRMFLALRFEREDEERFDEELRAVLGGLSAEAFQEDLAGLVVWKKPFPRIADHSVEPSWVCAERGSKTTLMRFHREATTAPDGTVLIGRVSSESYQDEAEDIRTICEEFEKATAAAGSEEVRTLPLLQRVREERVAVEIHDALIREPDADELLPLPADSRFTRRDALGVHSGSSASRSLDGSFYRATRTLDGVEYTAITVPSPLPPDAPVRNAWVSRWTVESVERALGPEPTDRELGKDSFVFVLLPTKPPTRSEKGEGDSSESAEAERDGYRATVSTDDLVAEVGRRLEHRSVLDGSAIEEVLTHDPTWTGSEVGWVWVLCRPDGSALWGLHPTRARSPVENADLFCAAAEARLH